MSGWRTATTETTRPGARRPPHSAREPIQIRAGEASGAYTPSTFGEEGAKEGKYAGTS